jgi:hypothetical protein
MQLFYAKNAIDGMFNYVSSFLEKVGKFIPKVDLPWSNLTEKWKVMEPYFKQANTIFPVNEVMIIAGILVGFLVVMLIIWGIKFAKGFIPFFGG